MRKYSVSRRIAAMAHSAVRGWRSWRDATAARMRGPEADRGASIVEYAGLLVIIALIVVAVRGLGLDSAISTAVSNAVNDIIGT